MEISRNEFELGILRVGELCLSPGMQAAELARRYAGCPGMFVSKGETSASVFYTLRQTVSFAGVEMAVRCAFRRGRLDRVTLSPADGDPEQSCRFLGALIGSDKKEYPWGRVETYVFPDYHDDYHGGDVYISYF